MPAFWRDLNLDQVISKIQGLSTVPVEKYYYCLPEDREGEAYRRAVYTDVKDTQVNRVLTELVDCIEEKKQAFQRKQEVTLEVQRYVWHLVEVACYCEGYTRLYEGLEKASLASEGLLAFRQLLKEYLLSQEFVQMRGKARQLRDNLHSFQVKLVIDSEQIIVTEEAVEGAYENRFCDVMGVQTMHMKSPFFQSPNLSELEQEIIRKFAKKQQEFFE